MIYQPRVGYTIQLLAGGLLAVVVWASSCDYKASSRRPESQSAAVPGPENPDVILATTTSTQDSGLLEVLIPLFEQKTGYRVKTIAVGTGQALVMGARGEADVVLVHAPEAEKKAIEEGTVIHRTLVMHNDFVLVGPPEDPAQIRGAGSAAEGFNRIARARGLFISRGDDSGTHKKELSVWQQAGIRTEGAWYQESGLGMGQTLNIASEKGGHTLTDRATFLATRKHLQLEILLEGDGGLLNIYHVMQVNPDKFSKVNAAGSKALIDFLVSREGQEVIGRFGIDRYGQPLFFPDAGKNEEQLIK